MKKKRTCSLPGCNRLVHKLRDRSRMKYNLYCRQCAHDLFNIPLSTEETTELQKELHRVTCSNDAFINNLMRQVPGVIEPSFTRLKKRVTKGQGLCPEENEE